MQAIVEWVGVVSELRELFFVSFFAGKKWENHNNNNIREKTEGEHSINERE